MKIRKPEQSCKTCRYVDDYSDTEPDNEVNAYCCHPWHSDPKKSPHSAYGGHWTHTDSWCNWWESAAESESEPMFGTHIRQAVKLLKSK